MTIAIKYINIKSRHAYLILYIIILTIYIKGGDCIKKQITTNCSSAAIKAFNNVSAQLDLSRNGFIETIGMLQCLENRRYVFNDQELDEILEDFSVKSSSTITKEFRNLHKQLPEAVKREFIKFFYSLNLIDNIIISSVKQSNFYKKVNSREEPEYLFYYGIIDMKDQDIDEYIQKLGINVKTCGQANRESNEYMYIGRMQQFKHARRESPRFDEICRRLGVLSCDCVKIHYTQINELCEILKEI